MKLPWSVGDHLRLFKSLNRHRVKYLVIGGLAAIVHGIPRTTRDIDLFIEPKRSNAERLLKAMRKVGFGTAYLIEAEGLLNKQITIRTYAVNDTTTQGYN